MFATTAIKPPFICGPKIPIIPRRSGPFIRVRFIREIPPTPEAPTPTADALPLPPRWLCSVPCFRFFSRRGNASTVQENKIKCWGRLPQQTTPQYHFIMCIKYIKKNTARNALILNALRGCMSPRNPQNVAKKSPNLEPQRGVYRGSNVVKKSPRRRGLNGSNVAKKPVNVRNLYGA